MGPCCNAEALKVESHVLQCDEGHAEWPFSFVFHWQRLSPAGMETRKYDEGKYFSYEKLVPYFGGMYLVHRRGLLVGWQSWLDSKQT